MLNSGPVTGVAAHAGRPYKKPHVIMSNVGAGWGLTVINCKEHGRDLPAGQH